MKTFCLKSVLMYYKKPTKSCSLFSEMLKIILKIGSTTNHSGLSIPKRFMKDLVTTSINGKLCWIKLEKTEKLLITVRLRRLLDLSSSTIDWFCIRLILNTILGTTKFWITSVRSLARLSKLSSTTWLMPKVNLKK